MNYKFNNLTNTRCNFDKMPLDNDFKPPQKILNKSTDVKQTLINEHIE